MAPDVRAFFDHETWTVTYLVKDPNSSACAIIDSVLDYEGASGRTKTDGMEMSLKAAMRG